MAAGTAVIVPSVGVARDESRRIYVLDPEWGTGDPACPVPHEGGASCHACRACHAHDANKMWTSESLADDTRAHLNCKCLVKSHAVSNAVYVMIFGPPSGPQHRDEFDARRDTPFLPWQVMKGVS